MRKKIILKIFIFFLVSVSLLILLDTQTEEGFGDFSFAALYQRENVNRKEDLKYFYLCLKEEGVKFYGSDKDDSTKLQKNILGNEADFLYFNCIESEKEELSFQCQAKKIKNFPTWNFPKKGEKVRGVLTIKEIENFSSCSF